MSKSSFVSRLDFIENNTIMTGQIAVTYLRLVIFYRSVVVARYPASLIWFFRFFVSRKK
jgi:hypothetical protein